MLRDISSMRDKHYCVLPCESAQERAALPALDEWPSGPPRIRDAGTREAALHALALPTRREMLIIPRIIISIFATFGATGP